MQQEVLEDLSAERQRLDGYPLVDAVEQRGEVQLGRQPQRNENKTANAKTRKVFRISAT